MKINELFPEDGAIPLPSNVGLNLLTSEYYEDACRDWEDPELREILDVFEEECRIWLEKISFYNEKV